MIQEKRRWSGDHMIQRESFEDFYTRKLEALKNELKSVIKGDLPYVTSETYACKVCCGRLKLHAQGLMYCLLCQTPSTWSKALTAIVVDIMRGYPDVDECAEEWEALQSAPTPRVLKTSKQGNEELGRKIREAREARGWTRIELAVQVKQQNGKLLSERAIQGYETAHGKPSKYVLEQIEKILDLKGVPNV